MSASYAFASLNQLFELKKFYDKDFVGLQQCLDTTVAFQGEKDISKLSNILSNQCDIELGNYQKAIDFFEDIVLNSQSSQDSIFAIIDLGYLYLRMNKTRSLTCASRLPQYIPENRKKYENERDRLIDLLHLKKYDIRNDNDEEQCEVNSLISNLKVFPNPTFGVINMEFYVETPVELGFVVYDQSGRQLQKIIPEDYVIGSTLKTLSVSGLSPGVYYISVTRSGYSVANKRIIIVK